MEALKSFLYNFIEKERQPVNYEALVDVQSEEFQKFLCFAQNYLKDDIEEEVRVLKKFKMLWILTVLINEEEDIEKLEFCQKHIRGAVYVIFVKFFLFIYQQIQTFRITMTTSQDTEKNHCSICLEEKYNQKVAKCDSCHNEFHKDCISKWIQKHTTCPLCRVSLEAPMSKEEKIEKFQVKLKQIFS